MVHLLILIQTTLKYLKNDLSKRIHQYVCLSVGEMYPVLCMQVLFVCLSVCLSVIHVCACGRCVCCCVCRSVYLHVCA